jgi:hypothetical protein
MIKHSIIILPLLVFLSFIANLPATQVTIGTGDLTDNLPFYVNFTNSLSETIYYQSEIGVTGTITALSFYNDFYTEALSEPVKIFLGTTDQTTLNNFWIPFAEMTQVFDGVVDFPHLENIITIGLDTPFNYTGGNLVLLVQGVWDINTYHSYDYFKCQQGTTLRTRNTVSDSNIFDPANPPTPYGPQLTNVYPKITLYFASQPPAPEPCFSPPVCTFGNTLLNSMRNQVVMVLNTGLDDLSVFDLSLSGGACFSLINPPALPVNLESGDSFEFIIHYVPTDIGEHTATVTITDNTAAWQHFLSVSGTGIDPTLYTLPYSQNFDEAESPWLPLDWSTYIEPVVQGNLIRTLPADDAPSQPNDVMLVNALNQPGYVILIAPPVAQNIPVNTLQVSFMASSWGLYNPGGILVGVMTDPADPMSFTQVQELTFPDGYWHPQTVQLFSYTGNGRYIAFQHPQHDGGVSIELDDIVIEPLPNNDLAATWCQGPYFPVTGSPAAFTVTVTNAGNVTQSDYQVQLLNESEQVLATSPGIPVAHGGIVTNIVNWTPQQTGIAWLRGKVVLAGDSSADNDFSPWQQVTVLDAGTIAVTLGEGTETARIPVDFYRHNSLFEMILPASETGAPGYITGLQFYSVFSPTDSFTRTLRVWMGETALSDLSSGWVTAGQLQTVFDGNVEFNPGEGLVVLFFDQPFHYLGGNLALMVQRPWDSNNLSSGDLFLCQTWGTSRSRNYVSDTVILDPNAPPTPTLAQLSGQFPKISIFLQTGSPVTDATELPSCRIHVSPNPSYGSCSIAFEVKNPGAVRLEICNLRGQMVRSMDLGVKNAGRQTCVWDGMDAGGQPVSSGIYLCRLSAGGRSDTAKLLRISSN